MRLDIEATKRGEVLFGFRCCIVRISTAVGAQSVFFFYSLVGFDSCTAVEVDFVVHDRGSGDDTQGQTPLFSLPGDTAMRIRNIGFNMQDPCI